MERFIDAAPDLRRWVQDVDRADASSVLLVMGANASGLTWPDALVESLARHHRVIRYDHCDTGRSTRRYAWWWRGGLGEQTTPDCRVSRMCHGAEVAE